MVFSIFKRRAKQTCPVLGHMGRADEFREMFEKDMNISQAVLHHLKVWGVADDHKVSLKENLTKRLFHEILHPLYGLAAAMPPQTEHLKEKLETLAYQGDMQTEFSITALQFKVLEKMAADPQAVDLTTTAYLHAIIDSEFSTDIGGSKGLLVTMGIDGRKGAFYLARDEGCTISEVRHRFAYDDNALRKAAEERAQKYGTDFLATYENGKEHWRNALADEDSFIATDGTLQTLRLKWTPPSQDPATKIILERLLPAFRLIQTEMIRLKQPGVPLQPTELGHIKMRSLYDAMVSASATPASKPMHTLATGVPINAL